MQDGIFHLQLMRRYSLLTNGHNKKVDNQNCARHPMESGRTDHVWTPHELLGLLETSNSIAA
jgi:hypothetical protein